MGAIKQQVLREAEMNSVGNADGMARLKAENALLRVKYARAVKNRINPACRTWAAENLNAYGDEDAP